MELPFNHPPTPFFASKDALLVQHEDPSRIAQAENENEKEKEKEKLQHYSSSTHTLCINFAPLFSAAAFFVPAFLAPVFLGPVLHHLGGKPRRGSLYYLPCPALCHTPSRRAHAQQSHGCSAPLSPFSLLSTQRFHATFGSNAARNIATLHSKRNPFEKR